MQWYPPLKRPYIGECFLDEDDDDDDDDLYEKYHAAYLRSRVLSEYGNDTDNYTKAQNRPL